MSTTERFHIGQMVRTIDSNKTGIIRQLNASLCEVDFDGLCITLPLSSLFPYNLLDGRALTNLAQYSSQKNISKQKQKTIEKLISFDLHFEKLPASARGFSISKMACQMAFFHKCMEDNIRNKGCRISFIHGAGDGTLSKAIRKELKTKYNETCDYSYDIPGITRVSIR